jgi:hypothetical protein
MMRDEIGGRIGKPTTERVTYKRTYDGISDDSLPFYFVNLGRDDTVVPGQNSAPMRVTGLRGPKRVEPLSNWG